LGELGISELAWVFNWALIIGGILTTIFMIALATEIRHWLRYPLGLLSVIATISGGLVGVYPMNYLGPHICYAMVFFNLGMVVSLLFSLAFLFLKRHPFPRWLAIPGLLNAVFFALFLNFPSAIRDTEVDFESGMAGFFTNRPDFIPLALIEWVVVIGILLWILLVSLYLIFYYSRDLRIHLERLDEDMQPPEKSFRLYKTGWCPF
jgi:hypothetical protein